VKKVTDTETTVFVYDGEGALVAEYSTATPPNPTTSYLTTDHLGSPRVITDKQGNVRSQGWSSYGTPHIPVGRN
jgi:uncharacterized protein RhaS with RHS repeats